MLSRGTDTIVNAQCSHMGLVRLRHLAGMMHLGERDFLGRAFQSPSAFDVPLECPELPVGELAGKTVLQIIEQSLRFKTGICYEMVANLGPMIFKGVNPGSPWSILREFARLSACLQILTGRFFHPCRIWLRQQPVSFRYASA
jgi:hypothetical protein